MNAKAYKTQMQEFQKYAKDIPSESYSLRGMKPPKFIEEELCDMLANAVSEAQEIKLISQGWILTTKSWKESLDKLENLKPIIFR